MKSFFQKSERKYLRKKSALVQDYMLGGIGIVSIGLFCNYYNNKLNPPDPEEDNDQNEISKIIDLEIKIREKLKCILVQKVGVTDYYTSKISNQIKAARGKQFLQEEQLKNLEKEINEKKVQVLVPDKKN